jgi:hypothetical protein
MAAFQAGTSNLDRNYGTFSGLWTGYIDLVAAAR